MRHQGLYQYTAKLRAKGLLVVVFFSPDSAPSVEALKTVQSWTAALPTQKWTALGVGEGDRTELAKFAEANGLTNVSLLLDYELYQTRTWGVSHLPSIYLVSGKTGRVLQKVMGLEIQALAAMQGLLTEEVGEDRRGRSRREEGGGGEGGGGRGGQGGGGRQAVGHDAREGVGKQKRPTPNPSPTRGEGSRNEWERVAGEFGGGHRQKGRRSNPKALRRLPSQRSDRQR